MALYYPVPPKNTTTKAANAAEAQRALASRMKHWQTGLIEADDTLSSSYIFPNPPSSPPTPYTTRSELSTPTELTFSPYSPSGSKSTSRSPSALSPAACATPTSVDTAYGHHWEWPQSLNTPTLLPAPRPQMLKRGRLTPRMVEKRPLHPYGGRDALVTADWRSEKEPPVCSQALEARILPPIVSQAGSTRVDTGFPFLSFFTSLLSTDDEVVDTITTLLAPPIVEGAFEAEAFNRAGGHGPIERGVFGGRTVFHGMEKFMMSLSEEAYKFRSWAELDCDNGPRLGSELIDGECFGGRFHGPAICI